MTGGFPAVSTLLPQKGDMCLLDSIMALDEHGVRCRAVVAAQHSALMRAGGVGMAVGLEYMAQSTAVLGSLRKSFGCGDPQRGMVVQIRDCEVRGEQFAVGQELDVRAAGATDAVSGGVFECSIADALSHAVLMTATITVAYLTEYSSHQND